MNNWFEFIHQGDRWLSTTLYRTQIPLIDLEKLYALCPSVKKSGIIFTFHAYLSCIKESCILKVTGSNLPCKLRKSATDIFILTRDIEITLCEFENIHQQILGCKVSWKSDVNGKLIRISEYADSLPFELNQPLPVMVRFS